MRLRIGFREVAIVTVIGLVVAYRYWRAPADDQIILRADGIEEIELQFDPTHGANTRGPVMGLGYARWVNFRRILYRGESFNQVGSGASLITRDTRKPRYVVREAYRLAGGPFGTLRYATLAVEDTESKNVVGTKEWLCGTTECRHAASGEQGWPGQHAALFVRKVLNPEMTIGGSVGIKPYPRTSATFERQTPSTPISWAMVNTRAYDCPADLSVYVRNDINQMVVSRPSWTFVAPHMTRQVRCTPDGLFVFSTTFPTDIFIDWLSLQGELLGQYHVLTGVNFPATGGGTFPFFAGVRHQADALEVRMAYLHTQWPPRDGGTILPQWEWVARISLIESAHRHAP